MSNEYNHPITFQEACIRAIAEYNAAEEALPAARGTLVSFSRLGRAFEACRFLKAEQDMRGIVQQFQGEVASAANLAFIFKNAHPAFKNLEFDIRCLGKLAGTIADKYTQLQQENARLKRELAEAKAALKWRVGR